MSSHTPQQSLPQSQQTYLSLSLLQAVGWMCVFVLFLWSLHALQIVLHTSWVPWGVEPLTLTGLRGIVFAPLIHGSWIHVFSNSLPLILLGTALLYGYPHSRWRTLICIWVISGLGVWLLGRDSYHMGASGLTHGLFYFLFIAGILRRDKRSIALLLLGFFMYGSMILTILPQERGISFESHLFGGVGGVIAALLFSRRDPKPAEKRYSWELENESVDALGIGIWQPDGRKVK